MNRQYAVQFIEQNRKPEWAILPYQDYLHLCELQDLSKEILFFRDNLSEGKEELRAPLEIALLSQYFVALCSQMLIYCI